MQQHVRQILCTIVAEWNGGFGSGCYAPRSTARSLMPWHCSPFVVGICPSSPGTLPAPRSWGVGGSADDCDSDSVRGTADSGQEADPIGVLGDANSRVRCKWHSHVGVVSATQSVVPGRPVTGSAGTATARGSPGPNRVLVRVCVWSCLLSSVVAVGGDLCRTTTVGGPCSGDGVVRRATGDSGCPRHGVAVVALMVCLGRVGFE